MDGKIVVLVATQSLSLADGLAALLKAIPLVDEANIARSVEETLQRVEDGKPRLVLMDAALLGSQPETVLEKVISLAPGAQRILLVDDVRDVKWMPKYAESILIKGAAPSAVATIVTNLLSTKGKEHERDHTTL